MKFSIYSLLISELLLVAARPATHKRDAISPPAVLPVTEGFSSGPDGTAQGMTARPVLLF